MWWKITIASVVAIFILVVFIRYRIDIYRRRLLNRFNDIFALPLPEDWVIPDSDTATIISGYLAKYDDRKDIFARKDSQSKKEWYDLRLKAFYDISVYAECCRLGAKYPYNTLEMSVEKLRKDDDEDAIVKGKKGLAEKRLKSYISQLKDDKVAQYQAEFQEVNAKKTGIFGIFRMTEDEKTESLHAIYNRMLFEAHELSFVATHLNALLGDIRVAAYRNIHLGVELLNFNRDNVGGKTLTTETELADFKGLEVGKVDFAKIETDFNAISSFASGAIDTLDSVSSIFSSDKDLTEFIGKNPKTSLAVAGAAALLGAAANVIDKHLENKEKNAKIRAEIVEAFGEIIDNYTHCKGLALRITEIAKTIVAANNGFIATYAPLRDKVFRDGEPLSMLDMQALALVIVEYRKISMAKL